MTEEIIKSLEGLNSEDFDVHILDDPWYSKRTVARLLGTKEEIPPAVQCVRVGLKGGMLEIHTDGENYKVLCYCCFGGNPDKGIVPLAKLKETVESLKDHHCPPWPG